MHEGYILPPAHITDYKHSPTYLSTGCSHVATCMPFNDRDIDLSRVTILTSVLIPHLAKIKSFFQQKPAGHAIRSLYGYIHGYLSPGLFWCPLLVSTHYVCERCKAWPIVEKMLSKSRRIGGIGLP